MIVSEVCEGGKTGKGTLLGIKLDELFGERDARRLRGTRIMVSRRRNGLGFVELHRAASRYAVYPFRLPIAAFMVNPGRLDSTKGRIQR